MGAPTDPQSVGLPPTVFMFTVDQLASMLNTSERQIMTQYLYYQGRSSGPKKAGQMSAVNIAADDQQVDWRVSSREFLLWCKRKQITVNQFSALR